MFDMPTALHTRKRAEFGVEAGREIESLRRRAVTCHRQRELQRQRRSRLEAPRSTRSSVDTVLTTVMEPARRIRAAASWPATSAPRNRRQNGLAVAVPVRSRSSRRAARIDSDGTRPKSTLRRRTAALVTSAARAVDDHRGSAVQLRRQQHPHGLQRPHRDRERDDTRKRPRSIHSQHSRYRTRRAREAPSARRIDISRSRAETRASRRFAMFMQATSRTSETATAMIPNSGRTEPTSSSRRRGDHDGSESIGVGRFAGFVLHAARLPAVPARA